MDISVYLTELLRLHDCVIIPDLGGFVTNYRPAEMDLAANSFNPPRKEIIFSPKLIRNDGLLVNHISQTEGVGYMEARMMVSEYVDETLSRLENGERIEIPMIGFLQYDQNEKLIFEAEVKENLLMAVYGLDGFHFPELRHNEVFISRKPHRNKEAVRPVFSSRRVKQLAVAVPVLLALLIIPMKYNEIEKYDPFNFQTSITAPVDLKHNPAPVYKPVEAMEEIYIGSETKDADKKMDKPEINQENQVQLNAATIRSTDAEEKYHLIGGCFKMKENAEKLYNRMKNAGYNSTVAQAPSGNFIVTIQSYADKGEAALALKILREQDPQAGYWMSVK